MFSKKELEKERHCESFNTLKPNGFPMRKKMGGKRAAYYIENM